MPASLTWTGPADGYRFFHLGGFFQAVNPSGEVACACAGEKAGQTLIQWPGCTTCDHAIRLRAVAALGLPEGFGREFLEE